MHQILPTQVYPTGGIRNNSPPHITGHQRGHPSPHRFPEENRGILSNRRAKRTPPPSTLRKRTRCRLRRRRPLRTGGRLGSTTQPSPRPSPDTNLAHRNLFLSPPSCISPYLRLQIDTNRRPTPNHPTTLLRFLTAIPYEPTCF